MGNLNWFNSRKFLFASFLTLLVCLLQYGVLEARVARADFFSDQEGMAQIGSSAFGTSSPADPRVIVANVIKIFLGFLGIIFVVLLIQAGYIWMTSEGDSAKIKTATDKMKTGVIGLLIIFSAYGLTVFVFNSLTAVTDPGAFPSSPSF